MTLSEQVSLVWNDYHTNISLSFKEIRDDQDFSDVTLAGESNFKIEAHRVILAASSKLLRKLLQENQHPHPLLYMRGIKEKHLSAMVDFMYHGQAKIHQDDLNEFLIAAKDLELKGLSGANSVSQPSNTSSYDYTENQPISIKHEIYTSTEENEDKRCTDKSMSILGKTLTQNRLEELKGQITPLMEQNGDGNWVCTVCGKVNDSKNKKQNMMNHIEAKHIGVSHPCSQCGKSFRSGCSLANHIGKLIC